MKYLAPNAFTAASLLCGLASISFTVEGRFVDAAWFALYCVLLDKADGFAARLLKAQSRFGVQFDSFADMVGFGVAPAVLFLGYFTAHPELGLANGAPRLALLGGVAVYVIGTASRLARYNISEGDARYFQGVPTTLAGGLLCSLFLACLKYGADPASFDDPRALGGLRIAPGVLQAIPALLIAFGVLMVTPLRVPKLTLRSRRVWNVLQIPNVVAVYVFGLARWLPEYLFAVAFLYLMIGTALANLSPTVAPKEGEEVRPTR